MERILGYFGYVPAQRAQFQPRAPAKVLPGVPPPPRLIPVINPDPEAAAVGTNKGFQTSLKRKQKFDEITRGDESDNEKREYCTVESEDWLLPFFSTPKIEADNLHNISDRSKKAMFALLYFSAHQITSYHISYVLKDVKGLSADAQAIRNKWRVKFRSWQHDVCTVFILPKAEALYASLINRPGSERVDLLALNTVQRRAYTDTQWPRERVEQKRLVFNMWCPIVEYLDLDAIFDPPATCTQEQLQHCRMIRHSLQTSIVLTLDAYIDVRIRYRQGIRNDPRYRLPACPMVTSVSAAGRVFFDFWQHLPELAGFPKFPMIKFVPVDAAMGRKRPRLDGEGVPQTRKKVNSP